MKGCVHFTNQQNTILNFLKERVAIALETVRSLRANESIFYPNKGKIGTIISNPSVSCCVGFFKFNTKWMYYWQWTLIIGCDISFAPIKKVFVLPAIWTLLMPPHLFWRFFNRRESDDKPINSSVDFPANLSIIIVSSRLKAISATGLGANLGAKAATLAASTLATAQRAFWLKISNSKPDSSAQNSTVNIPKYAWSSSASTARCEPTHHA